jgi:hypothetical protein
LYALIWQESHNKPPSIGFKKGRGVDLQKIYTSSC